MAYGSVFGNKLTGEIGLSLPGGINVVFRDSATAARMGRIIVAEAKGHDGDLIIDVDGVRLHFPTAKAARETGEALVRQGR